MHSLKIHAPSWRTQIFKVTESQQSFSTSTKPDQQGLEHKLCLPNHIPVHNADWFKCHFRQSYFKSDWLEIHFFSTLPFPFYAFVFTLAENMSLLPGLHVHDLPPALIFFPVMNLKEWVLLKWLKIKDWKKVLFLCISKCEDSNDGKFVEHLLLLNFHI